MMMMIVVLISFFKKLGDYYTQLKGIITTGLLSENWCLNSHNYIVPTLKVRRVWKAQTSRPLYTSYFLFTHFDLACDLHSSHVGRYLLAALVLRLPYPHLPLSWKSIRYSVLTQF